jgi:dihydrofolate reductase
MSRIVVFENVTLDGVMQSPGAPDEDTRGGFTAGGWAAPYADEVSGRAAGEGMAESGGIMLGRHTYEHFYSVWPKRTDGNPFTEKLNNTQKYVVSNTLTEPLDWQNSTLLSGDVMRAVAELRQRPGKDIVVLGSGTLVQWLMRHDLVDAYVLQIHPMYLGSGRRLFPDDGTSARLHLVDVTPTTTGVLIATYRPESAKEDR